MLIIGLGNIGLKYRGTYHNMGFAVADKLAKQLNVRFTHTECKAKTAVCNVNGERVIIAKPVTYMNLSGEAVRELMGKYKCGLSDIVVVYDDIDIPIGTLRLRYEGSAGTHNGMKNIIMCIGSTEFKRIRVGTGFFHGQVPLYDVVLSKVEGENKKLTDASTDRAADALHALLKGQAFENIMGDYNG